MPIVYTWPAGHPGLLRGYNYDRESGEFTIYHLKQFLTALASCPDLQKIHVVAHSRGTDVFLTALRELHIKFKAAGQDTRSRLKLGNVVLAAADLDWQVTNQRIAAERLGVVPERFTIYLNQKDRAIGFAEWLFASVQRVGQLTEGDLSEAQRTAIGQMAQLNVVDVNVKTDFSGHGYFISNPAVLSDLILLLRDNRAPGAENGRSLPRHKHGFWRPHDGYPVLLPKPVASNANN